MLSSVCLVIDCVVVSLIVVYLCAEDEALRRFEAVITDADPKVLTQCFGVSRCFFLVTKPPPRRADTRRVQALGQRTTSLESRPISTRL